MTLLAGDKCVKCGEGLIERSTSGFVCTACDWEQVIAEAVIARERMAKEAGDYTFKAKTFRIIIETPEEAEEFLRGLVLARQNNNSPYFEDLIDAVNAVLEPWRAARLKKELVARG